MILGAYLPPAIAEDFHIYRTFFQEVFKEEAAGSSYQGKASLRSKAYSLISSLHFSLPKDVSRFLDFYSIQTWHFPSNQIFPS